MMALNWYILRVHNGQEEQIRESLEKRVKTFGMEDLVKTVLVPTERVSEIKSGKKRVTRKKLYPGYIMVEMEITEESWFLVKETPGIGDFVGPYNKPSPMQPEEVERILAMTQATEETPKIKIGVEKGDAVKIKEGPFENFDGVVEEVSPDKGMVKVVVTIFGRPTPVDLEYWQLEKT
jgi:transcriptional antiterminator NusG